MIFNPPPVDPAQAPTNISKKIRNLLKFGQESKSTVEYPVVVTMLTVEKAAFLIVWNIFVPLLIKLWSVKNKFRLIREIAVKQRKE